MNKKAEFYALRDKHKPGIVVGTESLLTPNHIDSDVFPKSRSLGFTPFRQDRESGTSGCGVFVLVKDTFIAQEQKQLKTGCVMISVKIEMTTTKPLCMATMIISLEMGTPKVLPNLGGHSSLLFHLKVTLGSCDTLIIQSFYGIRIMCPLLSQDPAFPNTTETLIPYWMTLA